MNKYRIIKETKDNEVYFYAERRFLFWWSKMYFRRVANSYLPSITDYKFSTLHEAQSYLDKL